jgi:hypothetical protein
MGVAGVPFVRDTGSLGKRRALNALDANTAVVAPFRTGGRAPDPNADASGPAAPAALEEDLGTSALSYLPKGLTVIALRPYPWDVRPSAASGVQLAGLEAPIWYAILGLALVGLTALRRRLAWMAFPLLVGAATAVMYGMTEGNVGTAYRHRGEFVWVVALLAALGAETLVRRRSKRGRTVQSP